MRTRRLTEWDVQKLTKIIMEQPKKNVSKPHPVNTEFWKDMHSEIEGDGPETISETPDKLVIDGVNNIYTITKRRK